MLGNTKNKLPYVLSVLFLLFALVLSGCASNSDNENSENGGKIPQSGGKGTTVNVTMPGFKFEVDNQKIPAGPVTFHVTNNDQSTEHEMVLLKTDLQGSQLPTDDQGLVQEDKLESMGEVEELEPGKSNDLSVNLTPGHYVLLCNEPGHYKGGMYLDITVQ